jgi:hypothetical protein
MALLRAVANRNQLMIAAEGNYASPSDCKQESTDDSSRKKLRFSERLQTGIN